MYTIIISEKSPVCTSECSCENARMYDFVGKSMQSELLQVYKTIRFYHLIRICRNDPPYNQAENDPAETTHGRKPMLNECATSAFQRQGSDRYIGYWSLLPRRATEPIAASLIINIAISEPLLKHKQKVWSQIWSDKEFKIDQTLRFS